MINVEITRNANENNISALRRFSRKVQGSGIIPRMRSKRYSGRVQSSYKVKKMALKRIVKRAAFEQLVKLGKAPVKTRGRGRK